MYNGINLTLMIGPVKAEPVPKEVLDALTSIEVTTTTQGPSVFQLIFSVSTMSPLQTLFLLTGGASIPPIIRVVIVVTVNGMPEVIMDGVMTNHEIKPGSEAGHTTMTITGEDLTRVMDYIDFSGIPYPAMPAEARVELMAFKYAFLGIAPLVVPSVLIDVPIPTNRIPIHKGTDLCYIKRLAEEVGYVFYIEPGPEPGVNIAYWGPEIRVGAPQHALNINMDAHTNVESLTFNFDTESKKMPLILIQNEATKAPISIPILDITPFSPPLGLIPPIPKKKEWITGTSKLSITQALILGMAKAAQSADAVSASGSLDVLRYGHVLKARRLVGVRGAGLAFNGLYYVKSVTHSIKRGEYKQSFTLIRNGLISTIQEVPP